MNDHIGHKGSPEPAEEVIDSFLLAKINTICVEIRRTEKLMESEFRNHKFVEKKGYMGPSKLMMLRKPRYLDAAPAKPCCPRTIKVIIGEKMTKKTILLFHSFRGKEDLAAYVREAMKE